MDKIELSAKIKSYAIGMGFDACGFCKAESIGDEKQNIRKWLDDGYNAGMEYLANNFDKRCDPSLLIEGGKSIISLALNYYPPKKQAESQPQIAYYAYGKDYHDVMKAKMQELFEFIKTICPSVTGRVFCDSAPVLERYWAAKAGLGFIGKNTLLIIPKKGSYFFLGELIIDLELEYDKPIEISCGKCTRCLNACPTKAIESAHLLNANKCISYQTIENKGEITPSLVSLLTNRFYGCDICQQVCPWNKYAQPHNTPEFLPSDEFMALTLDKLDAMTETDYQRVFKGSAIKRAKHSGLKRNLNALKSNSIYNQ